MILISILGLEYAHTKGGLSRSHCWHGGLNRCPEEAVEWGGWGSGGRGEFLDQGQGTTADTARREYGIR